MKKNLISKHKVMSYELDSWGHVNNAVFLNYLEKARNDFMTQNGLNFNKFNEWEVFPVVSKSIIEYIYPAYADDELVIYGDISNYTAATFTLEYKIIKKDTEIVVVEATTVHVFVNKKNRPIRIPEEFMEKFIN